MTQPQFRAHTLMAAALINFCLALVNIVQCAASINWKAILIAVYRAGIKARLALETAKTKTITTIEQGKETVAIAVYETKAAVNNQVSHVVTVANPSRVFTSLSVGFNNFASEVIEAAHRG